MRISDFATISNIFSLIQSKASEFLQNKYLKIGNISIYPKEIEVYYYDGLDYCDNSVHCNELQQNNVNHFYIHRVGRKKTDSYKGGNYPGIDFVVSNKPKLFHTYLLRSIKIDGEIVVGPHNVLEAIELHTKLSRKELETIELEVCERNQEKSDVLVSARINLGVVVYEHFRKSLLRLVLCDDDFKGTSYPQKETLIVDFLQIKANMGIMSYGEAIVFAKTYLGYVPKAIKDLQVRSLDKTRA